MTSAGLFKPYDGQFLYPGTLEKDHSYRPVEKKKLTDMLIFKDQFVYLDDQAVFSNAWAGKLFDKHTLADARLFEAGEDFNFLVNNTGTLWKGAFPDSKILSVRYDSSRKIYWLLCSNQLCSFDLAKKEISLCL